MVIPWDGGGWQRRDESQGNFWGRGNASGVDSGPGDAGVYMCKNVET